MANWPFWKRKAGVARGAEAEQRVGPVLDGKNLLSVKRAHDFRYSE
ncbi:hypothetical protein ACVWXN_008062 [Bradyrhizobium sp. i1.4.4]